MEGSRERCQQASLTYTGDRWAVELSGRPLFVQNFRPFSERQLQPGFGATPPHDSCTLPDRRVE